jgi:serine/threonine protein kinase/formylglycine-generating enzyme required for sulfatase activity
MFFRRDRSSGDSKATGLARNFEPGETIGDFTLVRFIGHGGMGQVWEAQQNSMRRAVALKFILPGRTDAHTLSLFEREARAGGKASHPNLVRTLARGHENGVEWIAQELVPGSFSLRDAIEGFRRESQLPVGYYAKVAQLIRSIALGMEAAHAAGVIHRDLKPQNILIEPDDQPRVIDFGLARVAGDSVLSNTGDFAGTYHYMSPEQVAAKRIGLDHRTDVFSLGVVMYELLTLSRPFEGDTTQKIAEAIVMVDPPDPTKLRTQCPRDLAVICAKAMRKRPGARYATMKELAADLERHLKNEPIMARPATQVEKLRKWILRHPAPSVGIGVGVTALVVISGMALYALNQAEQRRFQAERAERGEQSAKDNLALAERNADESRRNAEAEKQASLQAQRNAEEAKSNAIAASIARDDATKKANDVLSLSAQKEYDDLVAQAEDLWPSSKDMIPRYEAWLQKARELLEGRPADESRGLKQRPSLTEHKAKLAQLRRDALPLSEEQIRADRESHPKFAEWQAKSADLQWRSRMLGLQPWPEAANPTDESAAQNLPASAEDLNSIAWNLIDPRQPVFGQELRALQLAKRAVAIAADDMRASVRATYAWALYRNGKLDDALTEMKTALSDPNGGKLEGTSKALDNAVGQWRGEELVKQRERRESLATDVAALTLQVQERRTYLYTDAEKGWWDRQLSALVSSIERLADPQSGLLGNAVSPAFGWGVQRRHDFARTVRERTISGPEAGRRWAEAGAAIAKSEKYRDSVFPGGALAPQEGLLPLGPDPQSGLWEFWHVQSGDEPERDKDGNFVRQQSGAHKIAENGESGTGIVLVLIPGGSFWMGAQNTDPNGRNHDSEAVIREFPVHRETLKPYFLSKYEMTQGQWKRFTGINPSGYESGFGELVGLTNPVETVDWVACDRVTRALGLELPSEAQWEYACRAGTTGVWWTGSAKESLADNVNLADLNYVEAGGGAGAIAWWPEFRDGFAVHAPVGRLPGNAFGLHEVCGNVWEWCFDAYRDYPSAKAIDHGPITRVYRGGGFDSGASTARSAVRFSNLPSFHINSLGLRPARPVL